MSIGILLTASLPPCRLSNDLHNLSCALSNCFKCPEGYLRMTPTIIKKILLTVPANGQMPLLFSRRISAKIAVLANWLLRLNALRSLSGVTALPTLPCAQVLFWVLPPLKAAEGEGTRCGFCIIMYRLLCLIPVGHAARIFATSHLEPFRASPQTLLRASSATGMPRITGLQR